MEVKGYKSFNKDKTNNYGFEFQEGKIYSIDGQLIIGKGNNHCNGFHFAKNLSDVFRYVDAINDDVLVAEVTSHGNIRKYDDDYNGYFDLYVTSCIEINRFLTRDEITKIMLNSPDYNIIKFLMTYRLDEKEKNEFIRAFIGNYFILIHLLYYQYDVHHIFNLPHCEQKKVINQIINKSSDTKKLVLNKM